MPPTGATTRCFGIFFRCFPPSVFISTGILSIRIGPLTKRYAALMYAVTAGSIFFMDEQEKLTLFRKGAEAAMSTIEMVNVLRQIGAAK